MPLPLPAMACFENQSKNSAKSTNKAAALFGDDGSILGIVAYSWNPGLERELVP